MTYKTGEWGIQAKLRSQRRKEYFREYGRKHPSKYKYKSHGESLGYKGEQLAQSILKSSIRIGRPCDLRWEGKLVDVKTGIKRKLSNKRVNGVRVEGRTYRWKFLLEKQKGKVDFFLIICKDLDEKVKHIFLIPDKDLNCKNLSITENRIEKFSKYLLTLL